jgi:flagellar hook-associated protein 1
MLGLFSTLDLAKRAMQTQMTGVEVAGHNIANVNTAGYTRQRVNITESLDVPTSLGMVGTSAQVVSIDQIADKLLNCQIQSKNSDLGFQQGRQKALQSAQDSLDEFLTTNTDGTSGSGLSGDLNSLLNAFKALSTSPTSTSVQ